MKKKTKIQSKDQFELIYGARNRSVTGTVYH